VFNLTVNMRSEIPGGSFGILQAGSDAALESDEQTRE
jgi:hypothetical protein